MVNWKAKVLQCLIIIIYRNRARNTLWTTSGKSCRGQVEIKRKKKQQLNTNKVLSIEWIYLPTSLLPSFVISGLFFSFPRFDIFGRPRRSHCWCVVAYFEHVASKRKINKWEKNELCVLKGKQRKNKGKNNRMIKEINYALTVLWVILIEKKKRKRKIIGNVQKKK